MAKFIEVTERCDNQKRLIAIDRIITVLECPNGSAFIEFYESAKGHPCGTFIVEGYEKIKCMLTGI